MRRPYVLLSSAMSVDGRLDTAGAGRLILSSEPDLDRVDAERAAASAIMVGAGTIRRDDPRLTVRSPERRAARTARGLPADPHRVTVTAGGDLSPDARFFQEHPGTTCFVYCPAGAAAGLTARLGTRAILRIMERADGVQDGAPSRPGAASGEGAPGRPGTASGQAAAGRYGAAGGQGPPGGEVPLAAVLADLAAQGVTRLLAEGGAGLGGRLLADGLVDELQLAIAPFFVGEADAPQFAPPARYPHGPGRPMRLAEARPVGGMVLARYLLDGQDVISQRATGVCLADDGDMG